MKKNYSPPKFSMETARTIRERFIEGESINSLTKRYGIGRPSIKGILKGTTYNKYGEHTNLIEEQKGTELF